MPYDKFWDEFGEWYSQGKRTACMIGIRSDESLNRFRAIMNERKETLDGQCWTKRNMEHVYNVYPIYDWSVKDLWFANYKYNFDYNKIYDYFTYAGIPIEKQRVAQPFNLTAKKDIIFYKIIEPDLWNKFLKRVDGVNSNSLDGINLPSNFNNYQDYCNFLLNTLKQETKDIFIKKINNRVNNFKNKELFYKTIANSILNIDINLKYLQNINLKNDKSLKQNTISKWSNQDD
jgi:predicted phosphoadenosine phosphosulfate sulfurtransferase